MKTDRKKAAKIAVFVLALLLIIYYRDKAARFLLKLFGAFSPVVTGFSIAYVINILMSFYEKHYFTKWKSERVVQKTRRPVCLIGAICTLVLAVVLVVVLIVPELAGCVRLLVAEIPPIMEKLLEIDFVNKIIPKEAMSMLLSINWQEHISGIADVLTNGIGNAALALVSAISSIMSLTINTFLSVIFAIYLLISKERLIGQMKKIAKHYIPQKYSQRIKHILDVADDCFRRFIIGQCTEAVILGVLCAFGMIVLGLPYAAMIGALIGLTALIPIAGAYIGAGAGAIMILSQSPMKALIFIIFVIVLQQLEGNLIYPRVVGKSIGLPAIYVLLAITIGGGIAGIGGMLLGVPVTSVIYRLVKEDIDKREEITNEK